MRIQILIAVIFFVQTIVAPHSDKKAKGELSQEEKDYYKVECNNQADLIEPCYELLKMMDAELAINTESFKHFQYFKMYMSARSVRVRECSTMIVKCGFDKFAKTKLRKKKYFEDCMKGAESLFSLCFVYTNMAERFSIEKFRFLEEQEIFKNLLLVQKCF